MSGYRWNDGSRQGTGTHAQRTRLRASIDPSFIPRNPREAQAVQEMAKTYTDYHWGAHPDKVIRIKDPLIPNVTAMGKLRSLILEKYGEIHFPAGVWVAWHNKHPRHRLYLPITNPAVKEELRNAMKHLGPTEPLQVIAKRAGGEQARYALPNVKAYDLGPLLGEVYWAWKKGDDDDASPPGSSYIHEHGQDGMGGTLPHVAVDVSGRLWIVGGDYHVKEAGIVG